MKLMLLEHICMTRANLSWPLVYRDLNDYQHVNQSIIVNFLDELAVIRRLQKQTIQAWLNVRFKLTSIMKIRKDPAKALRKMPRNLALRFFEAFDQIESGNISDLDIRMLSGRADHWRLRISAYRAIYTADFALIVIRVGSRGDIYINRLMTWNIQLKMGS